MTRGINSLILKNIGALSFDPRVARGKVSREGVIFKLECLAVVAEKVDSVGV